MSTNEVIDINTEAKESAAIDASKLTDKEKVLLNTEQDIPENINTTFQTPEYIERLANMIMQSTHNTFPEATETQLAEIRDRIAIPVRNLLADIAYYNHAAVHRGLEHVRRDHVLQPPTRYTLDFSVSAVQSILNGVIPGPFERICLENKGENMAEWTRDIPNPNDIPVDGIPARFIMHNQIYTGKLCFFSYLSENGDSHVISDIITFWASELGGFVHTFRIGYWQPIDPITGLFNGKLPGAETTDEAPVDVDAPAESTEGNGVNNDESEQEH